MGVAGCVWVDNERGKRVDGRAKARVGYARFLAILDRRGVSLRSGRSGSAFESENLLAVREDGTAL